MTDYQALKKTDITSLPTEPGVYRFYNHEEEVIYVGKAKNLKNRVSSYFTQKHLNRKTQRMVSEIVRLEFTIVHTEFDALLLENTLIKQYQPKYNIALRDDKSYPYICIAHEPFPKVFVTRKRHLNEGDYYGPFTNVKILRAMLDFLKGLYTIRTCHLSLTSSNIQARKFKVCLEFHVGNCKGPCEGLQTQEDYDQDIEQIRHILKGNIKEVKIYFQRHMQLYADQLEFEKAQKAKEKLEALETFQSKSAVVDAFSGDADIITLVSDEKHMYLNYIRIVNGSLIYSFNQLVKRKLDETEAEVALLVLIECRQRFQSQASEVLTNLQMENRYDVFSIFTPQRGDKKMLVDLSLKNVLYFKKEKREEALKHIPRSERVLAQLQDDLRLATLPQHIECFDNSNLQGTTPVSSMVCFKKGRPSKKDYRHFNIKTVSGPDDFASMREVVYRRYKRVLDENQPLPDLIVIDGGKGQLSAAAEALHELGLYGKMPMIGIAKRLEEIYYPEDPFPLHIDKKSESLRLLQQIRDEAHRFAITFHRKKRSQSAIATQLEMIPGLGPKTIEKLLKTYKSVANIQAASEEELIQLIGKAKAEVLRKELS